jgi:hypothetical protein
MTGSFVLKNASAPYHLDVAASRTERAERGFLGFCGKGVFSAHKSAADSVCIPSVRRSAALSTYLEKGFRHVQAHRRTVVTGVNFIVHHHAG